MSKNYNYYKARYFAQTAKRARSEGCVVTRLYGYVVRIDPPVPDCGGRQPDGSRAIMAWCKTKAIAQQSVQDHEDAKTKGYHSCPCGSDKQARACCGIPTT